MCVHYLFKKDEGILDYLANHLYKEKNTEIDFYMPQLCYLTLTKKARSVEKFILDHVRKYHNFGLKAMMYYNSFSHEKTEMGIKAQEMLSEIEATIINDVIPSRFGHHRKAMPDDVEINMTALFEKKMREEYLSYQTKLLDHLKYTASKLKEMPKEEREKYAAERMRDINRWLDLRVRAKEIDIETDFRTKF